MHKHHQRPAWLFVLPWSLVHLGGVNQVVLNLAREQLKDGSFEPIVLILDWEAIDPIWGETHGIKTVRWRIRPLTPDASIKDRVLFWIWKQLFFKSKFQQFCIKHNVAVINFHYANPAAFTLHQVTRGMKPTIQLLISFHGADLTSIATAPSIVKAHWLQLLMQVRAFVVCSNALGKRIFDLFGEKVVPTVIHNGLDSSAFVAMAGTSTLSQGQNILSVGKFEEKKGQDVLIKSFAAIADNFDDLDLILVGATDNALPRLRELCVENGIGNRVRFFPDTPHNQVAEFFRQATIFALPSRQEPFGIVLLEAGSFSLPVVATNVGGIPEILTDGVTGRLVAPDDPEALAVILTQLLNDPVAAKAMGDRLNQNVRSRFTWTIAHDRYSSLVTKQV